MDNEQISALMKYVRGDMSFAEWIESGGGAVDAEQIEDENEIQDSVGNGEAGELATSQATESTVNEESNNSTEVTTRGDQEMVILVSVPIFSQLAEMGPPSDASSATGHALHDTGIPSSETSSRLQPATSTQGHVPVRMTDLLLQGSAAKSAQKHGGTGVDEFMEEIPIQKQRKLGRRKRCELPPKHKHTMGHVNILWARGEIEKAKEICMELIRQVPKCSEPFQTLGLMFEEQGDKEKALQFFLIAAYLSKSGDQEEWIKLAMMSLEQNNYDQALTCYNQALRLDPTNVNILWDRAALCYQMDNSKKALEYYEMARQAILSSNSDEGGKYMDLVCEMAKLYHENKNLVEAINTLEAAFSKYPDHVNNQAINMLADLHMTSKSYKDALQMILKRCDVKKVARPEPTDESPLTSFSLLMSPSRQSNTSGSAEKDDIESSVKLILPEDLPIDLRVKIVICVIHLRQLDLVKEILYPLFLQPVESVGDLHIDVAEAYAENGDYEEALPIFDILIRSKKYNMAAVWLKKGECLHSLGRVEEAASAYAQVVNLAPNHLDARLILASLHQQLGRHNQALDVLSDSRGVEVSSDATQEDVAMDTTSSSVNTEEPDAEPAMQPQDFRLLFHKCALLQSQNRVDEFLEAGIGLFRLFFSDVYHKELTDIALKSVRYKKTEFRKIEALEQDEPRPKTHTYSSNKGDTGIRHEEWWEMFKKVVSTLSNLKRHAETQHLVLCALSSDRFFNTDFETDLIFMSVVAMYLNKEYKLAFDGMKLLIGKYRHKPLLWNLMARITAKSEDSRHQRYILRLLIKNPDELPLVLYSGHNASVSASYIFAVGEYVRAFRQVPHDPLVSLCLSLQYLHLACRRFPRNRHTCVIQGIIFMFQYLGLRGECQEAFYNIGRAFHQLGLLQFAVHYYNKALAFPLHEASHNDRQTPPKFSEKHDLHRETAFNLSLIYRKSGNELLAKELLRTHCWV